MSDQKTGLIAAGGALVLAVVGYFGLDLLGGKKEEEKKAAATTTQSVFSAAQSNDAEASAVTADVEQAAPVGDSHSAASTDTASVDTSSTDSNAAIAAAADAAVAAVASGDGTALSADEAKAIGEEVARRVAQEVAQRIVDQQLAAGGASASGGDGGLTEDEARRIGAEEGRKAAEAMASQLASAAPVSGGLSAEEAEQIGLAAGRKAAKRVAAKAARDVVRNEFGGQVQVASSGSVPSTSSEPAPSGGEPAVSGGESAPVVASSKPRRSSRSGNAPAGADALKAWWQAPSSGEFGLVYAGQPKGEGAIALLFSDAPSADALNANIKVLDDNGEAVAGNWEAAGNPRLVVFRGVKPGRYTLVVGAGLNSSSGKAMGKDQHGPVYIAT